jgi:type I restriction enzyme R subunit
MISNFHFPETEWPELHEAAPRGYFIDLLLKEAGWSLETGRSLEFAVSGKPNAREKGFVDDVE